MILAPIVASRKGEQHELVAELRAQGFARLRVDGKVHEIDAVPRLSKNVKHSVDVVVDRLKVRPDAKQRLAESFETALRHADGRAIVIELESGREHLFSARFACPACDYSLAELEPRLFSFNNPMGACPKCDGLARSPSSIPSAWSRIRPLPRGRRDSRLGPAQPVLLPDAHQPRGALRLRRRGPFEKLPEAVQAVVLEGSKEKIAFSYLSERGARS